MEAELYLERDTFFHRLDPRTKIILMLVSFTLAALFQHPHWVLAVTLPVAAHALLSQSLPNLRRVRSIILVMGGASLVLWTLFTHGEDQIFLFIYRESFQFALGRTMMMLAMITAGIVFLSTTRNEEFIAGMICLGLPFRVGFTLSMALRFVPTIMNSAHTVVQAQRSRGHDLDSGGFVQRIKNYLPLLAPVFISSIRSTHLLSMALESRAFGARPDRTSYLDLDVRWRKTDTQVAAAALALLVVCIYLKCAGFGKIPGLEIF